VTVAGIPPDIEAEAQMLAARTCSERRMYLDEVAACYRRGPDVADALRREVERIKCGGMCGGDPPACTG